MEQSQKFRILKAYLGYFCVPVPKETRDKFAEKFTSKEITSIYAEGTWDKLKELAAWALLHWGEQNYKAESTYDILNRFFGIGEEEEGKKSFYDVDIPVLVIYHLETTLPNKYTADCLAQTWEERKVRGLPTIILSCCASASMSKFFSEHGVPVIKLTSGLKKMRNEVGEVAKETPEKAKLKKEVFLREKDQHKTNVERKKDAIAKALENANSGERKEIKKVGRIIKADL